MNCVELKNGSQIRYGPKRRVWKAEDEYVRPLPPYGKKGGKTMDKTSANAGNKEKGTLQYFAEKGKDQGSDGVTGGDAKSDTEKSKKWNVWEKGNEPAPLFSRAASPSKNRSVEAASQIMGAKAKMVAPACKKVSTETNLKIPEQKAGSKNDESEGAERKSTCFVLACRRGESKRD